MWGRIKRNRHQAGRLKADQEVSSFCCTGLSQIDAFLLGRMKTSEMALGLSLTLYFCVAANFPFLLLEVWGNSQPHIVSKVIDRQWTDKIVSVTSEEEQYIGNKIPRLFMGAR